MDSCKQCSSKKYVLSFFFVEDGEMKKDCYCFNCILGKMDMLFGEDTQQIIKDFFEINRLKVNVEVSQASLDWKVKHILTRDHMTPEKAREFVYGVSYKAPTDDGGEEKSEDK